MWLTARDPEAATAAGTAAEESLATGGFLQIPFCDVGAPVWTGQYSNTRESAVVVREGVLDPIEGIALIGGNVTPDTIPNASTCKAAWRQ